MAKHKKKQAKTGSQTVKLQELEVTLKLTKSLQIVIVSLLVVISAALSFYYVSYAYSVNHENGFPLDDPWIHLTFARNLAEYGSFSYYKNEIVTAGSTSPVYTLILAAGFFITKNEMILSYVLGILFFALSAFVFY